jgi:uncharacterized protein
MPESCFPGCSLCCRYVAIPIDEPRDKSTIDQARWMVSHRDVWLTVDGTAEWHVQFLATCEHLDVATSRCGIYADRFDICQAHELKDCEGSLGEGSETILFRSLEEFDAYLAGRRVGVKRKAPRARRS